MPQLDFRIGEKIVYPTHGVGIVEQIHKWPSSGTGQDFYLLRIYSSSLRVMVPFSSAKSVGLRRIVKRREVQKVLQFLSAGDCSPMGDWKCRFKDNTEKMRSGSLIQVAEVLKCLLTVCRTQELSFRERKMLERSRYLIASELAVVNKVDEAMSQTILEEALATAGLKLLPT